MGADRATIARATRNRGVVLSRAGDKVLPRVATPPTVVDDVRTAVDTARLAL